MNVTIIGWKDRFSQLKEGVFYFTYWYYPQCEIVEKVKARVFTKDKRGVLSCHGVIEKTQSSFDDFCTKAIRSIKSEDKN